MAPLHKGYRCPQSSYGAGRRANLVFGSDRARHWVQCEAPGAFNAALVDWLDALAAERVREEHRQ
jgi:pimeloyl-ACP methyl ester carboxylesterase